MCAIDFSPSQHKYLTVQHIISGKYDKLTLLLGVLQLTQRRHLEVLAAVTARHNDADDDFLSATHSAGH